MTLLQTPTVVLLAVVLLVVPSRVAAQPAVTANCGQSVTPIIPSQCAPVAAIIGTFTTATRDCESADCCTWCEGDGECNTSQGLNNCFGDFDIYYKQCSNCTTQNCGQSLTAIPASQCASVAAVIGAFSVATPDCEAAQCCSYCEADNECNTSNSLNNCGDYDIYFKQCVGCTAQPTPPPTPPTAAPTAFCGQLTPLAPSQCATAIAVIGPLTHQTPNCEVCPVRRLCAPECRKACSKSCDACAIFPELKRDVCLSHSHFFLGRFLLFVL
jgi:hypothetical protein